MRVDDSGVAGFFEDLPVLAFVLAGVAMLLLACSWIAYSRDEQRNEVELSVLAEDVASRVAADIKQSADLGALPLIGHVRSMNFSSAASLARNHEVSITIAQVHPSRILVASFLSDASSIPLSTGYGVRFVNVLNESGLTVVLEVQAIVW